MSSNNAFTDFFTPPSFATWDQARLVCGGVMFSTCPSVRTFVRLLPMWTRYFVNEWTYFDANWHKWSTRQVYEKINFECQRSRSHEAEDRFGGLAETSFSIPLSTLSSSRRWLVAIAPVQWHEESTGLKPSDVQLQSHD